MWWTLETQWTQDTRPKPPQPFIGSLQKGVKKSIQAQDEENMLTH